MREPLDSRDSADAWELQKDNICCLSTNDVFEFTEQERSVLGHYVEHCRRG
jgi:hypothetical protein